MDHTVLPANTPCLPFLRKRLRDGATPNWGKSHPIAAYYSSVDPEVMKGSVGLVEKTRDAVPWDRWWPDMKLTRWLMEDTPREETCQQWHLATHSELQRNDHDNNISIAWDRLYTTTAVFNNRINLSVIVRSSTLTHDHLKTKGPPPICSYESIQLLTLLTTQFWILIHNFYELKYSVWQWLVAAIRVQPYCAVCADTLLSSLQ